MAIFAGPTSPHKLAGIFGLSSYLLLQHKFKEYIPTNHPNKETPIFMGHGSADELVKHEWGLRTAQELRGLGFNVDFRTYKALGHSADSREINDLEKWIQERLPPVADGATPSSE